MLTNVIFDIILKFWHCWIRCSLPEEFSLPMVDTAPPVRRIKWAIHSYVISYNGSIQIQMHRWFDSQVLGLRGSGSVQCVTERDWESLREILQSIKHFSLHSCSRETMILERDTFIDMNCWHWADICQVRSQYFKMSLSNALGFSTNSLIPHYDLLWSKKW